MEILTASTYNDYLLYNEDLHQNDHFEIRERLLATRRYIQPAMFVSLNQDGGRVTPSERRKEADNLSSSLFLRVPVS